MPIDREVPRSVLYGVRSGTAWITINRPEALNALNRPVREGLLQAFQRAEEDDDVKAIVLTGAGDRAFCAGGDLREMASTGFTVPPPDFVPQPGRTLDISKPYVVAVNGAALAGGFLLTQSADLVVAATHATFGITEVRVGRGAPWAAPLSTMIPPRIAMEMLMTGDPLSATRAYEVGLVNRVVEAEDLVTATEELVGRIVSNAPLSVRAAKAMVQQSSELGRTDALAAAEKLWEPVYLSADAQEGPRAFAEKRLPVWTGR